jgi:hypothetical protein
MAAQVVRLDALRSVAYGSITGSYVALGTAFTHLMRIVKFTNNTDGDMLISFNGSTDNIFIPAGSFTLYDMTTNKEDGNNYFVFQLYTQPYIKYSTAPTVGAFYLECVYGNGE